MMDVMRILAAMIVMTVVPLLVGTIFLPGKGEGARFPFCWISGQMLLWAGFQCICVPAVLKGRTFGEMERVFACYVGVCALLAGAVAFLRRRKQKDSADSAPSVRRSRTGTVLWAVFFLLLGIQIFLLCYLAYNEGDDAYYVAVTANIHEDGKMYVTDPYTGRATGLNARHSLAPFPVWAAMIALFSGLSGAATAHVTIPLVLVPMTYCLYYLIGKKLIGGRPQDGWEMPLFLCFAALLVIFGGYSTFSAENFLLVRGAQGKSVLANLIIPFLFYEMFCIAEKLDRGEKTSPLSWLLIGLTMTAGSLCSTLGSLLVCIFLAAASVCLILVYRRRSVFFGAALCMAAPVLFACLYVIM